jgi:hypothetical protein
MKWNRILVPAVLVLAAASVAAQAAEDQPKLVIGGTTYTKYLWGNLQYDGSVYNFTTVPGEGFGDNGAGSEVELLLDAKVSKKVEVRARLHSRFNQNQWTNFGGFGIVAGTPCVGGDCGESDPRSNQYVKLRGVNVTLTPGYKWVDTIQIGANDFGMFDPFVIGRIRYIDRDNASGLLFSGSAAHKKFTYDVTRISLPRLWAGPNFNTGLYTAADAAYGAQFKGNFKMFDVALIGEYVYDIELENRGEFYVIDQGRSVRTRFRNSVIGARFAVRPASWVDISGQYYKSWHDSIPDANLNGIGGNEQAPANFFGLSGFSPVTAGNHTDDAWKLDLGFNDLGGSGFSINAELFDIGSTYTSMMAARRESDVLLTEGHDAAFAFPGPSNAAFGVFGGNPTRIGYGGWMGNAVQVATINVDNEFTDFDETLAETVIGWKGITVVPAWRHGALELSAEGTYIDYNTNWQAFGSPGQPVSTTVYPVHELDTGVGHNFRSAYAPFQDKKTMLALVKARYVIDVGKGIDIYGKVKYIKETDNRLNDSKFLPFAPGDCPGGGVACANVVNPNDPGANTSGIYGNPPIISTDLNKDGDTLDPGEVGYQWKPFDSISDDDRDLKYWLYQVGAGYQLSNDLYGQLTYEYFDANLKDGNTAFQAYQLHEMASGQHKKNIMTLGFRYVLAGAEFGLQYQYAWGTFDPDFGGGFTPQFADLATAQSAGVRVGSLGFHGRFGGWNSLEERDFRQNRLKAFMKVQF